MPNIGQRSIKGQINAKSNFHKMSAETSPQDEKKEGVHDAI